MKIVIADGLPASAIELLSQPDWNIDNRQGRQPAELMADLSDADALVVRSATKVTRDDDRCRAEAARDRSRRHGS